MSLTLVAAPAVAPYRHAQGQLVGIVSLDDLMRLLGREMSNLGEGIKDECAFPE